MSDSSLPDLCPVCGETAAGSQRLFKAHWDPPWRTTVCMLPVVILYVWPGVDFWIRFSASILLAGLCVWLSHKYGKRGLTYYRLCARHDARRTNMPWRATFAGIATLIAMAFAFIAYLIPTPAAGSTLLPIWLLVFSALFGGIVTLWLATRVAPKFTVHKIRCPYIWLSGVHRRVLDQVPEATPAELTKLMAENS